jgi:hypothetical protein
MRPAWLFNRSLGRALFWAAFVVLVAAGINLVGISIVGDVSAWGRWLDDHAGYFLIWRLCLYGAVCYGWLRMRRRLSQDADTRQRLIRAEIGAVVAVLLLEVSVWLT